MSFEQLSVILRLSIKPEKRELYLQELKRTVPLIRQQEGCLNIFIYEDASKPNKFMAIQTWASQEHFHAHLQSNVARELMLLADSVTQESSVEKIKLYNM